jgi:hypothetical protein
VGLRKYLVSFEPFGLGDSAFEIYAGDRYSVEKEFKKVYPQFKDKFLYIKDLTEIEENDKKKQMRQVERDKRRAVSEGERKYPYARANREEPEKAGGSWISYLVVFFILIALGRGCSSENTNTHQESTSAEQESDRTIQTNDDTANDEQATPFTVKISNDKEIKSNEATPEEKIAQITGKKITESTNPNDASDFTSTDSENKF